MKERPDKSRAKRRITNADVVIEDRFERLRTNHTKKLLWRRLFYAFTAIFFCVVFLLICGSLFLRIKQINIVGNEFYDDEQLLKSTGVEEMQNLYSINKKAIESSIKMNYPYIKNVTITRQLPTTLNFAVTVEKPAYYIEISDEFFVLSESLRVLELCSAESEALGRSDGIKKLIAPQIIYAVVGQTVRFSGSTMYNYVYTLLSELSKTSLSEKLQSIDVSDKFSIKAYYDGRFTVILGNNKNIAAKSSFAIGMINSFAETAKGTVNAENVESGYAIVDNQSDLQ